MSVPQEVHVFAYVNRPYAKVRDVLKRDAMGVFQRATAGAAARAEALAPTLRAHIGPLELGAEVAVEITWIEDERSTPMGPATKLHLRWAAAKHPELFPAMDATLDVYALAPDETQVDFLGKYHPPLGVVGVAFDIMLGHKLAEAVVHRFVNDIAKGLQTDVGA